MRRPASMETMKSLKKEALAVEEMLTLTMVGLDVVTGHWLFLRECVDFVIRDLNEAKERITSATLLRLNGVNSIEYRGNTLPTKESIILKSARNT